MGGRDVLASLKPRIRVALVIGDDDQDVGPLAGFGRSKAAGDGKHDYQTDP